ncbi:MAG: hypothetical protein IPH57_11000 [Saprospiraceae bacterium]|nr:hypothetical protein [Saprospiraceae bacterium]
MSLKLTTFSKLLIALVVMVILFFVLRKYIPQSGENSIAETTETTSTASGSQEVNQPISQSIQNEASTKKLFEYTAPIPGNGKLKGVVELGAAGFNSFIVNMDKSKVWELKKAEWGNSLVYDNMASSSDIREGLKKYISKILDYGVSGKDIHFVVSSGAQKIESTQKIINELKNMGYVVNKVTPEQEAKYALKSVLPEKFFGNAFVVDIGSGNTKLSWIDSNGRPKGIDTYGAKYYADNLEDKFVYNDVLGKAKQIPKERTTTCFIIGGVPFDMAKQVRNEKERYTVIKNPDFYKADGAKMKSGLNIYKSVKDATGCELFVFDWDANFTIGFLLGLN